MRNLVIIFVLFWPAATLAQVFPVGSGALDFKEKFKISGGCDSFTDIDVLFLTVNANGTWVVDAPTGTYFGNLVAADSKGLKWDMVFDAASLALYTAYLQSVASNLCGTAVTITGGEIKKFQVKFKKDLSKVKAQIKASATGATALGTGKGKHSIKAKGLYNPGP